MLKNGRARERKIRFFDFPCVGYPPQISCYVKNISSNVVRNIQSQTICDSKTLISIYIPGNQTTVYSNGPRMVRSLSGKTDNYFSPSSPNSEELEELEKANIFYQTNHMPYFQFPTSSIPTPTTSNRSTHETLSFFYYRAFLL